MSVNNESRLCIVALRLLYNAGLFINCPKVELGLLSCSERSLRFCAVASNVVISESTGIVLSFSESTAIFPTAVEALPVMDLISDVMLLFVLLIFG